MIGDPYAYASEKFGAARRALMLPHPRGEAEGIASAFHECDLGLHDITPVHLDDSAGDWVRRLGELMDTDGIDDPTHVGTYRLRAEQLTLEEQFDLSRIVDELAYWFHRRAFEAD